MKAASKRQRGRLGHPARDNLQALLAAIEVRDRTQQPACIWVARGGKQILRRRRFDDLPCVHHGHPIGDFQALRFALADMAADVAQARAFWHQVAHLLDQGEPAESESAMVKLLATEMAVRVTNQAMQLHGGNGYTTERRVERYWRDARLTTIFEGTSEIQRRIISDRMLPRPGA